VRTSLLDHVPAAGPAEAETGHGANHMIHSMPDDDLEEDDFDEDEDEEDEDDDGDEDDDEEEETETWQVARRR
jgi:hypothetical protein